MTVKAIVGLSRLLVNLAGYTRLIKFSKPFAMALPTLLGVNQDDFFHLQFVIELILLKNQTQPLYAEVAASGMKINVLTDR